MLASGAFVMPGHRSPEARMAFYANALSHGLITEMG